MTVRVRSGDAERRPVKRLIIKTQLLLWGHCYCASPHVDEMDNLDDLEGDSIAEPWKSWAQRAADRREAKTGTPWHVTKWGRE
jgi:hypothetical protein